MDGAKTALVYLLSLLETFQRLIQEVLVPRLCFGLILFSLPGRL